VSAKTTAVTPVMGTVVGGNRYDWKEKARLQKFLFYDDVSGNQGRGGENVKQVGVCTEMLMVLDLFDEVFKLEYVLKC
jgi:hypothetical protein